MIFKKALCYFNDFKIINIYVKSISYLIYNMTDNDL